MSKPVYGFAGRGAFDRNVRAMRSAERASHGPGWLASAPGFVASQNAVKMQIEVREAAVEGDRRHIYPARVLFRETEAASESEDWVLLGEVDDDEEVNCLAISVNGEVLKKGVRYEGRGIGTFEYPDPDNPFLNLVRPVILVDLEDGADLVRVATGTAEVPSGYFDAYLQEPAVAGSSSLVDGERIWVKAVGTAGLTPGTYVGTFIVRLPEGVEGRRAVYGVAAVQDAAPCRDRLANVTRRDRIQVTFGSGTGVCVGFLGAGRTLTLTQADPAIAVWTTDETVTTILGEARPTFGYSSVDGSPLLTLTVTGSSVPYPLSYVRCQGTCGVFVLRSVPWCDGYPVDTCFVLFPNGAPRRYVVTVAGGTGDYAGYNVTGRVVSSSGCFWAGGIPSVPMSVSWSNPGGGLRQTTSLTYPDGATIVLTANGLAVNACQTVTGAPVVTAPGSPTGTEPTVTVTPLGPCVTDGCGDNSVIATVCCLPSDPGDISVCDDPAYTMPRTLCFTGVGDFLNGHYAGTMTFAFDGPVPLEYRATPPASPVTSLGTGHGSASDPATDQWWYGEGTYTVSTDPGRPYNEGQHFTAHVWVTRARPNGSNCTEYAVWVQAGSAVVGVWSGGAQFGVGTMSGGPPNPLPFLAGGFSVSSSGDPAPGTLTGEYTVTDARLGCSPPPPPPPPVYYDCVDGTCQVVAGPTAYVDDPTCGGSCPPPPPPPPPPSCCDGTGGTLEGHDDLEMVIPDGPFAGTYSCVWQPLPGDEYYAVSGPGGGGGRLTCVAGVWTFGANWTGGFCTTTSSSAACDPFAVTFPASPGFCFQNSSPVTVAIA